MAHFALPSLLLLPAVLTPAHAQQSPSSTAGDAAGLYAELEALAWDRSERFGVPGGAIAVLQGGRVAWAGAFGFTELGGEEPVTPETVFNVGAIAMPVTAWLVMSLVDEGVLDLDEELFATDLGWKPGRSLHDPREVTVRRVLHHTSGLGMPTMPSAGARKNLLAVFRGADKRVGSLELAHAPDRWNYSEAGFALLQVLIETKTERSFAELAQERVLEPLGMSSSSFAWTDELKSSAARPHDENRRTLKHRDRIAPAANGLQTTVLDLARFVRANLPHLRTPEDPVVLGAGRIEELLRPTKAALNYGMGFDLPRRKGRRWAGHGGASSGWSALMRFDPETGDGFLVLLNASHGARLIFELERRWSSG